MRYRGALEVVATNGRDALSRVVLVLIAVVIALWLLPQGLYTFDRVSERGQTVLVRVNRITGSATFYRAADAEQPARQPVKPASSSLTSEDLGKLDGRARPGADGRFSGHLYNGTTWKVTSITIGIELKDASKKKTLWDHSYRVSVSIPPLAVGTFAFDILDGGTLYEVNVKDKDRWGWTMVEAKGIPSE